MDTSHCLEYLIAQASRLKYATYTIGFMKVRMEGRCEKNITTYLQPPPPPPLLTHTHTHTHTPCVSANKLPRVSENKERGTNE